MGEPQKTIGVLTGGGDCPGLNAVLRAIVKTAANKYGWKVIGIEDGFEGLIVEPVRCWEMTPWKIRGILQRGGTILGTTNRGNPFAYVGQNQDDPRDVSGHVIKNLRNLGIDALIVIGGEGSLKIALKFGDMGVPVVGVPKTIDNDLRRIELTFGYDTAVNTAMDALDKLHSTAESHHRVIVVEVMGRHAGWIALGAGMAGGADVILIPEIPFLWEAIFQKVRERQNSPAKFSILVAGEGARPLGGQEMYYSPGDPGGTARLGGIGQLVAETLMKVLDVDARVTVLGHVQRGGSPTAFDRILATRFGHWAVELVAREKFGEMVTIHRTRMSSVPIQDAVASLKTVPTDGELVDTAEAVGICLGR